MSERICLIVDDEPSIRTYLRLILEREQVQSLEADHAAQALRIIQKLGGRLDLLVSDIQMPGEMNGIDLAHSVRNSYPLIPIILISGYADEKSLRRSGVDFEFIQKPFVPETITSAARRLLSGKRSSIAGSTG